MQRFKFENNMNRRHANSPDLRGRLPLLWLDFISRTILENYVKLPICLQHVNVKCNFT